MGVTTPNISIYVPAAGETNYDAAFAAGMVNIDQHDHSGAPNKGVPISGSGLAAGSVTYDKLAANVVDTVNTGLGTHTGGLANQITTTGILKALATLSSPVGFLSFNGSNTIAPRTIQQTAFQTTVTAGDGVAGDPVIGLPPDIRVTSISFDTGTTLLNTYKTGTFTPNLLFGGLGVGITYTTQVGKYWQIGNLVYFNLRIVLSSKGSSTGTATISGPGIVSAADGFNNIATVKGLLILYAGSYIVAEITPDVPNTSVLISPFAVSPGLVNNFNDGNFTNTSNIYISGFYWTA